MSDRAVSAHHAALEADGDAAWIQDLSSSNGTYVDGVRTSRARLVPGSRIRIGRTDLFVFERRVESSGIVAASPEMKAIIDDVSRYAALPFPVLIQGASGVGKEGIARLLHQKSSRAERPYITVNAGAFPRDLLESELFGHEKGSFTGATSERRGVFEQAHTGTLFLDEIGELDPDMQVHLLRVLECWEVRRVGSEVSRKVDVRVVCATHQNIRERVRQGKFRLDLYYRLAQLEVNVPELSSRPADIKALATHFLRELEPTLGPRALSSGAVDRLLRHSFQGNARELRNILQRAAASSPGLIDVADIERALAGMLAPLETDMSDEGLERLLHEHGSVSAVARALNMPRTTIRDRLRRSR